MHIPTAVLIGGGRLTHQLLAHQGGELSLDRKDSPLEHEVRVWWIYPSTAAFVGGAALSLIDLALYLSDGSFLERYHWSKVLVALAIAVSYITSNIGFLHAMSYRSSIHVKAYIAGNGTLACGLLVMMIVMFVRLELGDAPESVQRRWDGHRVLDIVYIWVLRLGFVLFWLAQAATYTRLWSLYDVRSAGLTPLLPAAKPPPPDGAPMEPLPPSQEPSEGSRAEPRVDVEEQRCGASAGGSSAVGSHVDDAPWSEGAAAAAAVTDAGGAASCCDGMRRDVQVVEILAAFGSGSCVLVLLIVAWSLNSEALWEAFA